MSCHPRMAFCGTITGMAGAALGAGSVLGLGSTLGWLVGLLAGSAVGGMAIWLACQRLLRDATACLAALGTEEGRS